MVQVAELTSRISRNLVEDEPSERSTWTISYSELVMAYSASLPVVDEDVENAQQGDEETGAPLGLETDSHHDTGAQSYDRDDDTSKGP